MPKLEHVELIGVNTSICGDVPEHLSRVPRLRHLSTTYQLEQRHVELITKRCQELRSLELLNCESLTGIDVIWRQAGSRLTSLKLDQLFSASDDNIVELIKGCPRLQSLTIGGAEALTCALPARAAAARRAASPGRPLRLDLSYTNLSDEYYLRLEDRGLERNAQYEELKAKYEDLIIVLEKTMDEYDDEQSEESSSDYNYFDYSDYEYDDDYDYIYPGPFMRYE
ncbi:F-box/LRR-repeat protein 2-like [Leguminivora glycinivorella]|uniref:F-box/LRR-repeat protein 2-like n=1 Tax=Leguminivora glycinivorella TaxID=1035111 RepID=UPI00200F4448|nr:F-box/LRR-repeat protein 2-like [Leguminivora glycinivorella]